ncbi:MAG: hypothetical protein L3K07_03260 [Thermoplasmata archaeon]|nr:hypothetical protein [Thermoplasmata archaeon]
MTQNLAYFYLSMLTVAVWIVYVLWLNGWQVNLHAPAGPYHRGPLPALPEATADRIHGGAAKQAPAVRDTSGFELKS